MNYSRLGFLLCCFLLPCLVGVFATFSIPAPVVDEMHQRAALQAVLTAPDPKAALANLQGAVDDDTAAIAANGPAPLPTRIAAAIANMQTEELTEARAAAYHLRLLLITMTILSAGFGAALLGPGQKHDN
jgi:hypothetical protein